MNLLLEIAHRGSVVLDAAGLLGLGLLALAALRLARRHRNWAGTLMVWGAGALLGGRIFILLAPQFLSRELLAKLGYTVTCLATALPVLLLTGGLAAVVWGLWGHEQELRGGSLAAPETPRG